MQKNIRELRFDNLSMYMYLVILLCVPRLNTNKKLFEYWLSHIKYWNKCVE